MEKLVDTVVQRFDKPPVSSQKEACLVHIYPTGPWMGMRHALANQPLIVGRGEDCDIRVLDTSVSRRHVRIEKIGDDFYVLDMQSTNGTYVNDKQSLPGDPIPMRDGDYVRVGNCIFRYLASGNVEADYHEEIYRLTIVDALTQIANVRYFNESLVLIETGQKEAMLAAERIRQLVESHAFRFDDKVFHLTISLGVAECPLDG